MIFTNEEISFMRKIIESIMATNKAIEYTVKDSKFNIDVVDVVEYVKNWVSNYKIKNNIDVMTEENFKEISKDCINDFNIRVIAK